MYSSLSRSLKCNCLCCRSHGHPHPHTLSHSQFIVILVEFVCRYLHFRNLFYENFDNSTSWIRKNMKACMARENSAHHTYFNCFHILNGVWVSAKNFDHDSKICTLECAHVMPVYSFEKCESHKSENKKACTRADGTVKLRTTHLLRSHCNYACLPAIFK